MASHNATTPHAATFNLACHLPGRPSSILEVCAYPTKHAALAAVPALAAYLRNDAGLSPALLQQMPAAQWRIENESTGETSHV